MADEVIHFVVLYQRAVRFNSTLPVRRIAKLAPHGRCLRCDGCRRTSAVLEEIQERSWSLVVPAVVLLWLDILPCLAPGVYTMLLAWTAQVSWKHVGWGIVRAEVLVGMIGWLWAYSYFFHLSSEKIVQDAVFGMDMYRRWHTMNNIIFMRWCWIFFNFTAFGHDIKSCHDFCHAPLYLGGHQGWHAPSDPRVRQSDDWMLPSLAVNDSFDYAASL